MMRLTWALLALAFAGVSAPAAAQEDVGESFSQKKVAFSSALPLREGRLVGVLIEDWLFCYPKTGEVYRVPRGYITDYASVPWYSRYAGFSEFGPHKFAALIHDWLYSVGEGKGGPNERALRRKADDIFLYGLEKSGMGLVQRRAMYRAVRTGGAKSYGAPEEWDSRFAVIELDGGRERIAPGRLAAPPEKPAKAAIGVAPGCADLGAFR
jgi:hypothetical protein